jgi:hypothetical protein
MRGHGSSDTNFIPKQMTLAELRHGYNWLIRALYAYDSYSKRLLTWIDNFSKNGDGYKRIQSRPFPNRFLRIIKNVLWYYLITRDKKRRQFFISTILKALKGGLNPQRLEGALHLIVLHKHFHEYVAKAHGDPESAGHLSPYSSN